VEEDAGLRGDARRNRAMILAAAREVFEERGSGAPLEDVARRAGVGVATLYRRFPDRAALVRAVALEISGRVADEAQRAIDEEPTAFAALARYAHYALDARIAALIPALLTDLRLDDPEYRAVQQRGAEALGRIVDAAQAAGDLRPDVAAGDVGLLLIRLARPLPQLPAALDRELAHRHLDLVLAGLRGIGPPLSGPRLGIGDLRTWQPGTPGFP
jgi:AcrR family transcriptional regulator